MSKRRPTATCKLCQQTKLLCQSHIIPEFCYARLYDKTHEAIEVRRDRDAPRALRKGEWEYLLCDECEAKLSKCETYFKRAWYKEEGLPTTLEPRAFEVEGLDHDRFRLFHLSILWRASISGRPLFKEVQLGVRSQERLRQMFFKQDGGLEANAFAFTAECLVHEGAPFHAISDPQKIHYNPAVAVFQFLYAGCAWTFYVASYTPPEIRDRVLRPEGVMPVGATDIFKFFNLDHLARLVHKSGRTKRR